MSRYIKAFPVYVASSSGGLAQSASSGGGADAKVTFAAPASSGYRNFLHSIAWSYSTTPTSGALRVYDGTSSGRLVFEVDVMSGGPGSQYFDPLAVTPGNAMTVILTQAGSSIIGRLNPYARVDK